MATATAAKPAKSDASFTDTATLRAQARKHIDQGPVTQSFPKDREVIIAQLNKSLATEWVCVLRYMRHYYTADGLVSEPIKAHFLEHANEERAHADKLAERIVQLGGEPDLDPATLTQRSHAEYQVGKTLKDMVKEDLKPSDILTKEAFENAIRVNGAVGGSTNAVLHLLALAGRVGVELTLDDWDRLGRDVPTIVNLQPSGKYLMEEFYYAGGLPVVIKAVAEMGLLHNDAITVTGDTIWNGVKDVVNYNEDVIVPRERALTQSGGIAVLRGNLAPKGCVLKPSAASPHLMQHRGRAVVFESIEDYHARINRDDLDIDESCIMVLKYCGPKGYPGMAEVGNMGLPPKVLKKGITDMIRISDARMSGTAYGTVILHTAPEAADGGPLALVETGDMIAVDVPNRSITLEISDEDMARRRAAWVNPVKPLTGGYGGLYVKTVMQADTGADLDFLIGPRGSDIPMNRDSH